MSFRFSDSYRQANPSVQQRWVQTLLRAKGWIVPNYELAPDLQQIEILRVVVRESVTAVMVDRLVADLVSVPGYLRELIIDVRRLITDRDRGRPCITRISYACTERAPIAPHYGVASRQARRGFRFSVQRHLCQTMLNVCDRPFPRRIVATNLRRNFECKKSMERL